MYRIFNFFALIIIIFIFFNIYKYYSSSKNIDAKNYTRSNIDQILKEKIADIPVLANDTNNVIVFNDLFENEINNEKKRSFWDLLKNK